MSIAGATGYVLLNKKKPHVVEVKGSISGAIAEVRSEGDNNIPIQNPALLNPLPNSILTPYSTVEPTVTMKPVMTPITMMAPTPLVTPEPRLIAESIAIPKPLVIAEPLLISTPILTPEQLVTEVPVIPTHTPIVVIESSDNNGSADTQVTAVIDSIVEAHSLDNTENVETEADAVPAFAPLKTVVISEYAKVIVDEMIANHEKLNNQIDSGDFLRARKFYEDRQLRRSHRQQDNRMRLDEQIGEEIYRRAFTNFVEMIKDQPEMIVNILADEAIRRDEELKFLVASGRSEDIADKFKRKQLKLHSIIKNGFFKNRSAIVQELFRRAEINKPKPRESTDETEVDLTVLVNEALGKDGNLNNLVKKGKISEVKSHFITKTLKQYRLNDGMDQYKAGVANALTRRAEDYSLAQTIYVDKEVSGYANEAMEKDNELKVLVESGQPQFVEEHFLSETLNLGGINPKLTDKKTEIAAELIRRADWNRIHERQSSEKATAKEIDARISAELYSNENKPRKKKNGKRVSFVPEMNTVKIFEDY